MGRRGQHRQPDQQRGGGDLRNRRDERRRGIGRAFVDVRRPEMEREKGKLKEKGGQREDDRQHPQRLGEKLGQLYHDIGQIS
jgi:hypothetical protein